MTRASDGQAVTGRDYRGKVVMLYFGYTNCPDVCPATLANLTGMLGKVQSKDMRHPVRHRGSRPRYACRC